MKPNMDQDQDQNHLSSRLHLGVGGVPSCYGTEITFPPRVTELDPLYLLEVSQQILEKNFKDYRILHVDHENEALCYRCFSFHHLLSHMFFVLLPFRIREKHIPEHDYEYYPIPPVMFFQPSLRGNNVFYFNAMKRARVFLRDVYYTTPEEYRYLLEEPFPTLEINSRGIYQYQTTFTTRWSLRHGEDIVSFSFLHMSSLNKIAATKLMRTHLKKKRKPLIPKTKITGYYRY